jgi:PAS domain S-box-containing protein
MSRILIVEDSRTQAEHLRLLLEAEGFAVGGDLDGRRGLDLFTNSDFDLVLTDVVMPDLDGYELCRRIKADRARGGVPVILLTTLNDPMDILRGIECGADNFLTKPYQADALLSRVRYIFANQARRAASKLKFGVQVAFLDKTFTITSDQGQILDLLIATCEDVVRANRQLRASQAELAEAKAKVEKYARHMEGQARSSEDKYRRLMEHASDAIVLLDVAGRVLEVNRRAEELLGRPAGEVVGSSYEGLVPAAERDAWRAEFAMLLRDGSVRRDNVRFDGAGGRPVCVDYTASVVDLGGERVILAIVHDASERERLEGQLRQSQKMEAVGRLAGGVAHDFNNLLTVINGYGELLLDRLAPGDPARELMREMTRAGERATSLTRQLLTFSRQQAVEHSVLDLNAVVADVTKMLRRLIGEDIELANVPAPALGSVRADPGQLEQILINLAVNARDAMPQGGRLTIETGIVELDDAYARSHPDVRPGPYALLAVSDTGTGMDEQTRSHIFEPFFTTKEAGKGTGLGLAVVHGIVRQAGGHVEVYSEPGRGSTFKVYLPRAEEAPRPARPTGDLPRNTSGTETVLLVEDAEMVRLVARHALQIGGYTVLEASDGEAALRVAEGHAGRIDLLLTDVVMPRMGGRELAERLTRARPGLRVLYLSGYTDEAVVRHGLLEADAAFLQKPFSPASLAAKVRAVLDQRPPASGPAVV